MTINADINSVPMTVKLTAGVGEDIVFRCTNTKYVEVQFNVTGGNPLTAVNVHLGNNGSSTTDALDAAASAALTPILAGAVKLYERSGTIVPYITFSLTSALGTTVVVTAQGV